MCTIIILRRPDDEWPVIIGSNRDESTSRPWKYPDRHWPDRSNVLAGLDCLAGGTWLGRNDDGVVAVITNGERSLGPAPMKRSRGELPLEALDHADAAMAAKSLSSLDPMAYQPFKMLIADNKDAYWLQNRVNANQIRLAKIPVGYSMLTSQTLNNPNCPRIKRFLPQFVRATPPKPDSYDWIAWQKLLTDCEDLESVPSNEMIRVRINNGFGTVCSTLIALPSQTKADQLNDRRGHFLFSPINLNDSKYESYS